jgi:hypothetical protein
MRSQQHFFGEVPEQRPWAIKRDDRPAALAGRSELIWIQSAGIPVCLHRPSILSHCCQGGGGKGFPKIEKPARNQRETVEEKQSGSLHRVTSPALGLFFRSFKISGG